MSWKERGANAKYHPLIIGNMDNEVPKKILQFVLNLWLLIYYILILIC